VGVFKGNKEKGGGKHLGEEGERGNRGGNSLRTGQNEILSKRKERDQMEQLGGFARKKKEQGFR